MSTYNISVAGHIGAGKTTLVHALAKAMNVPVVLEPASENPYLEDFYKDKRKWALQTQMCFMAGRIQHHKEICGNALYKNGLVQDRSAFEDRVFANRMHSAGDMDDRDIQTYNVFFDLFVEKHGKEVPDVVLYLNTSTQTVLQRIRQRGIESEQAIDTAYIASFETHYATFLEDMASKTRVISIDWNKTRTSDEIEEVTKAIVAAIRKEDPGTKGRETLSV